MTVITKEDAQKLGCKFSFSEVYQRVDVPVATNSVDELSLQYGDALRALVGRLCGCPKKELTLILASLDKNCIVYTQEKWLRSELEDRFGGEQTKNAWMQKDVAVDEVEAFVDALL